MLDLLQAITENLVGGDAHSVLLARSVHQLERRKPHGALALLRDDIGGRTTVGELVLASATREVRGRNALEERVALLGDVLLRR